MRVPLGEMLDSSKHFERLGIAVCRGERDGPVDGEIELLRLEFESLAEILRRTQRIAGLQHQAGGVMPQARIPGMRLQSLLEDAERPGPVPALRRHHGPAGEFVCRNADHRSRSQPLMA